MSKRVFKTELDAVNNSLQSQVTNSISKTIVDAKGDIVTASAADTPIRLAVGTNEHRLVADSATTSGLKYVADTTNYAVGAKGDLLVGTAADTVTNLAVGTNGHVLTADSATTSGLKWAAAAAGGKLLQVVSAATSTTTSLTTTYVDITNMSITITPSAASSKIYLMYTGAVRGEVMSYDDAVPTIYTRFTRGGTDITGDNNVMSMDSSATGGNGRSMRTSLAFSYLDSPSSTSALTYKLQAYRTNVGGTTTASIGGIMSFTAFEIGA